MGADQPDASDEPDDPEIPDDPPEDAADVTDTEAVDTASTGVEEPDAAETPDAGASTDTEEAESAPAMPRLDDALKEAIRGKVTRKERLEAGRLARKGLRLHKKDLDAAIGYYDQALAIQPRNRSARYNLACAWALKGRPDKALLHLIVLRDLNYRDKLNYSRVDSDWDQLRSDPRYTALTGYTEVSLVRTDAVPSASLSGLVKALKDDARYPATAVSGARAASHGSVVYYRDGHREAARTLADFLEGLDIRLAPGGLEDVKTPIIIQVADVSVIEAAALRAVRRFLDAQLEGKSTRGLHELKLKKTGFFTEKIFNDDAGRTIKRDGTWKLEGGELVRSYRESVETDDAVVGPDEKDDRLSVKVKGKLLRLGGIRFKR